MSLIELVLNKKGPLAKVWISAHHERKLTKAQALQVDVSESVEAILEQEVEPIALRMSGQLMLGVVRIYSRKVQYLFDDCKEARERIVMAFRPGAVDLPEDQLRASKAAITLPDKGNDFDMLLNDLDWTFNQEFRRKQPGADGAPALPRFNRIYAVSERSLSVERQSEPGIESQEVGEIVMDEDMDLGLDLGDETVSLEFARDAQSRRASSVGSELRIGALKDGRSLSREADADPMAGMGMDFGEPMDLGLDMGEGFDFSGNNDGMDVPMLDADNVEDEDRARRESTRLTTPPPLEDQLADQSSMATITPRTAARINKLAETRAAAAKKSGGKERPRKKVRIMAADEEIELQLERGQRRDLSGILAEENYVPADEAIGVLMQVRDDPQSFFLPTIKRGGQSYFVGGLPGIAPGLAELFTFPTNVLRRGKDKDVLDEDDRRKRQRLAENADDEDGSVEAGRRAESRALSEARSGLAGKDIGAFEDTFDLGGGADFGDMGGGLDLGFDDGEAQRSARDPSAAPSLAQTEKLHASDEDCLIAMFDARQQAGGASQSAAGASTIADEAASAASRRRNGYSQNTVKAENLIRQQVGVEKDGLMVEPAEGEGSEMSLERVAAKGSRRAAASFFFELLVLGTRDNIKIKQDQPFSDIKVASKPGLWADHAVESELAVAASSS